MAPLVLWAAGTLMQMGSQYAANRDKGMQELENAKWYDEQAQFAAENMYRALKRTEVNYAMTYGSQVSAYAKGGVDSGSGSALSNISNTLSASFAEIAAVKREGELNVKLARSRGALAQSEGKTLTSGGYNLMQAGTTAISSYASFSGGKGGYTGWLSNGSPGGYQPGVTKSFDWQSSSQSNTGILGGNYTFGGNQ